jgi:hypothetical protein
MRKHKFAFLMSGVATAASLLSGVSASADYVTYLNDANYLQKYSDHGNSEVGDQITLSRQSGPNVTISGFEFEYFANQLSGNETAQVFFRTLDGPGGTPGSVFYNSDPFSLDLGQNRAVNTGMSVEVPLSAGDTFVWSVAFQGIETGAGEKAGILFYDPPTIGSSDPSFYWVKPYDPNDPNTSWGRFDAGIPGPGKGGNFGARITAVPEPGTWALLLSGLTWVGLLGYRRKS